jgi:hypothetical protein
MFQTELDRLITFVSEPEFSGELTAARKAYFAKTGEVFENDHAFEMRMSSFLEWFTLDRPLSGGQRPCELFVERNAAELNADEAVTYRNFTHTIHSLFQTGRLRKEAIDVKDLISGKSHAVYERRKPAGVETADIIEARLIPTADDRLMFSPSFCFHPREARKQILKLVKAFKKAATSPEDFIFRMAYLRLKADRYKHVSADKIYADGAEILPS